MNEPKAIRARTGLALVLLPLVAIAVFTACGGGEPSLAESPLPAPTVTGTIVFEKAVNAGVGGR